MNLLNKTFPAEVKIPGQNYACARFSNINPHTRLDGADRDVLRPKFVQELGVLNEVIATSFDLSECCQYVLENTEKGKGIRQVMTSTVPKPVELSAPSLLYHAPLTPVPKSRSLIKAESTNSIDVDDADDFESDEKFIMCVVPLFQWMSMAPDTFDSMRIENLIFHKESKSNVDYSGDLDIEDDGSGEQSPSSVMDRLKYSLREVGLLTTPDEEEANGEIFIIERHAIERNAEEMKATPGLKVTLYCRLLTC